MQQDWHTLPIEATLSALKVQMAAGLDQADVSARRTQYGSNQLIERGGRGPWRILWEQLTSTLIIVLLIAAVLSAATGDAKDAIAILVVVIANTLLGFFQEFRAEKAVAALKKLAVPKVRVRRSGVLEEIPSNQLVPGDIIFLEAGNLAPADGRVIECASLRMQEAALTGESVAVEKNTEPLTGADLPLGDRRNMVYMGTSAAYGHGIAVVTATGMQTELGRIATMLQTTGYDSTPLQKRLDRLGKQLAGASLAVVGIVFAMGLLRGVDLRTMFLTAISLAVAAVPEGLPAVVTIALALGAQRMLKRKALIRKLPAVETLGSVTIICSDKTGTLTENRMTVTVLQVSKRRIETVDASVARVDDPAVALLLTGSVLCNDAQLQSSGGAIGDPTETALLVAASRQGINKNDFERTLPRVAELPFDSRRKRMTTIHQAASFPFPAAWNWQESPAPYIAFSKGAPESLIGISNRAWIDGRPQPLDDASRKRIAAAQTELSSSGARVLAVGFRPWMTHTTGTDGHSAEQDLIFVGLVGMIDPPRAEVKQAVATCKAAGIRPIMITGDHALTAQQIARELGIPGERALIGQDVERLSMHEFQEAVKDVSVFARVSPEHKLKIVEALQKQGQTVAMTGDGVNDAPALKKADIGVAMGITGTDVSKEAADMVLLDDNFSTIVAAVEEGRIIYENIRKFIKFMLTTNSAEISVMFVAPFLGMPIPLLPLQLLWINLVTDGPAALTLGIEPGEPDIMRRPPHDSRESLFARGLGGHVIEGSILLTLATLAPAFFFWRAGKSHWQTILFTTMVIAQMGNVLAIRSARESFFTMGMFSNKWLLAAVAGVVGLQVAVVYAGPLQSLLKTEPLTAQELAVCLASSLVVFFTVELVKWFRRRKGRGFE